MKPNAKTVPPFAKTRVFLAVLFGLSATASVVFQSIGGCALFVMAAMGAVGCDRTAGLIAEVVREVARTKRHTQAKAKPKKLVKPVAKLSEGTPPGVASDGAEEDWNGDKAA